MPADVTPRGHLAPAAEARLNSLALGMVLDHVGARRDCCVLDLGPGFGANVEFLSQFAKRIVIEDLYRTLAEIAQPFTGPDRVYSPVYEALLPYGGQNPFDVILLWDLLDYLDRDDIRRLGRHLARLCHRGSLVIALISTRQKIPLTPANFKIVARDGLRCEHTATAERDCPRHSQLRLLELMPGFRVKRSFLLRGGLQEYLLQPA